MRRRRRHSQREFLWPFILIISIGLIIVLLVQLVFSFFAQKELEMRNKANFYIDHGRAEMMEWGSDEFLKAYNGGVILEGDTIQTKAESRGVLVLFNGTEIRFDESTEVTVETLESHGDEDELAIDLHKGQIWVKQVVGSKGTVDVTVKTGNIDVHSGVGQYSASDRGEQSVRVFEGSVDASLVERDGKDIVIDEVNVGVGQQIYMSSADVANLIARTNMNFLTAVSDSFKDTDFYKWNMTYEFEESSQEIEVSPDEEEDTSGEVSPDEEEDDDASEDTDPELALTNPSTNPSVLDGDQLYITGTVTGYALKVVVTSYLPDGSEEPYQLSLFQPGDTDWSYNAAIYYENLYVGENKFVVTAYDASGYEADTLTVTINVVGDEEESEDSEEVPVEEEDSEEAADLACGSVTTPVVSTVGGETWTDAMYVTSEGYVRISGTVECADAIEINGYKLTLFESGSASWSYTADPSFGNLFEGENTYEVVALDAAGNRSEPAYFSINYTAPAVE